jgi:hypothetical protein
MKRLVSIAIAGALLVPPLASAKTPDPAFGIARRGATVPAFFKLPDRLRLIGANLRAASHDSTRPATAASLRMALGKPRLTDPLDIVVTPLVWPTNLATGAWLVARGKPYEQYYGR